MDSESLSFKVGQRVEIIDKALIGTVAFNGTTQFQPGKWIGVVLDEPKGKNNGTVKDVKYFECAENCGLFVRAAQLRPLDDDMASSKGSDTSEASSAAEKLPSGLPKPSLSGLKPPSSTAKRPSVAQPTTAVTSPGVGSEPDVTATPAASGKLKPPGSKLATPGSTLKPSPSSEKFKTSPGVGSGSTMKPSPSTEALANKRASETAAPRSQDAPPQPQSKMPLPSSGMSRPAKVAAPADNRAGVTVSVPSDNKDAVQSAENRRQSVVQEKVQQIQKDVHKGTSEGIIKEIPGIERGSAADAEYWRAEVKDLTEKLETLRCKRLEDKQKLVDYEKCKIQMEQLLEYKLKMQEVHSELQRQLQQAKKEARDAVEAREVYTEEMSGLSDAVELATLDKEVAEERAEMLQKEVETLKEKVEELTLDLDVLKGEIEQKGTGSIAEGMQVKQLQQQNERLKEAVVKLRDLSANEKQECQKLTKDLDLLKSQVAELTKRNEKLITDNKALEEQLGEIRDQVDAAMGAEELVEKLTERNLAMEERVRQLEETVEDLEQMRTMDEELQETAKESERELLRELDTSKAHYAELRHKLEQTVAQVHDHENTITKFRKHTAQLQDEIQDLKDKLAIESARKSHSAGDDAANGPDVGFHQPFLQTRAQSEIVEGELNKLELELAHQQMRYLKAFLPDNFTKPGGDNDALLITLVMPKLRAKAELLLNQVKAKYPIPPNGISKDHVVKSHKSEQWSFVARFSFYVRSLISIISRYESVLAQCSTERLARLAQLQPEISAHERMIDFFVDALKKNQLDENANLDNLEKINTYFSNLYAVHLTSEDFNRAKFLFDSSTQLSTGISWMGMNIKRIRFYLLPGQELSPLWKMFDEVDVFLAECEAFCRKIRSHIPADESAKIVLVFGEDVVSRLVDAHLHLDKAAQALHVACASAGNQVTLLPDVEGLDSARMTDLLQEAYIKICGKMREKTFDEFLKLSVGSVMANASVIAQALDAGEYSPSNPDTAEAKAFPPLLERAHARRQEMVDMDGLRWQIEKKDSEMMDLKKALRLKAEEVSEMLVRKDMAEKRLATTGKEGDDRVVKLQRKLEDYQHDMKKKEREFETALDNQQQEMDALEKENSDLKERLKMMSKRALLQGISAGLASPSATPTTPFPTAAAGIIQDSPLLLQEIESLRSALSFVQQEKYRLQGQQMQNILDSLPPLEVPRKPVGILSQTGLIDLDQASFKRHDDVNNLVRDLNRLQKDYLHFMANNKVVDLSKRKAGTDPPIFKQDPSFHLTKQVLHLKRLAETMTDLDVKMKQHRANNKVTELAKFASPASESRTSFGRISVPTNDASAAESVVRVTINNAKQYRELKQYLMP